MLALLPQILFLGTFAATLIRVTLAIMFAYDAWVNASKHGVLVRIFALVEAAIAAALFVGAWTQLVAIVGVLALGFALASAQLRAWPRSTIALMIVMTLTLVVTGPGAIAFDLPL